MECRKVRSKFISRHFHGLVGDCLAGGNFLAKLSDVLQTLLGFWCRGVDGFHSEARGVPHQYFKWGFPGGGVSAVVVGEFGKGKEIEPVVWRLVDGSSEELLNLLIDPLSFSIGLRVICSGHCRGDSQGFPDFL